MPRTENQFEEIREAKRELIINTALHLFAESGFHTTSIRQIAKKAKISKDKMQAIGIANMKDAPWKPDSVIRYMARRKVKQYPGTVILTDPEYILRDAWGLGNCNQKSVAIIIGTDKKVHYYKKGKLNDGEIQQAVDIIRKLVQ